MPQAAISAPAPQQAAAPAGQAQALPLARDPLHATLLQLQELHATATVRSSSSGAGGGTHAFAARAAACVAQLSTHLGDADGGRGLPAVLRACVSQQLPAVVLLAATCPPPPAATLSLLHALGMLSEAGVLSQDAAQQLHAGGGGGAVAALARRALQDASATWPWRPARGRGGDGGSGGSRALRRAARCAAALARLRAPPLGDAWAAAAASAAAAVQAARSDVEAITSRSFGAAPAQLHHAAEQGAQQPLQPIGLASSAPPVPGMQWPLQQGAPAAAAAPADDGATALQQMEHAAAMLLKALLTSAGGSAAALSPAARSLLEQTADLVGTVAAARPTASLFDAAAAGGGGLGSAQLAAAAAAGGAGGLSVARAAAGLAGDAGGGSGPNAPLLASLRWLVQARCGSHATHAALAGRVLAGLQATRGGGGEGGGAGAVAELSAEGLEHLQVSKSWESCASALFSHRLRRAGRFRKMQPLPLCPCPSRTAREDLTITRGGVGESLTPACCDCRRRRLC